MNISTFAGLAESAVFTKHNNSGERRLRSLTISSLVARQRLSQSRLSVENMNRRRLDSTTRFLNLYSINGIRMAKTSALQIDRSFERRVRDLAKEGVAIADSYADLTNRMLGFAAAFKEATDMAAKLDKGESGIHHKHLMDELKAAIKTDNLSIWSRWNTIGTHAKTLLEYSGSLPPQRDSLYELALAVKENKPVKKWIEGEKVTAESSVRDLRALRKPKTSSRATNAKRGAGQRRRHLNATVTLCFGSYEEAANVLSNLLVTNKTFEISSHHAFTEALKVTLGQGVFEKISSRIR